MTDVRFGVTFPEEQDYSRIGDYAQMAEELGFDSLWATDNPFSGAPASEVLTTLTIMGASTSRATVGTAVLVLPARNPVPVAQAIATLDVFTGGRVILGVGVGGNTGRHLNPLQYDATTRGRRCEEQIALMKRLWTEREVTHEGEFYQMSDYTLLPQPVSKPHPPIWLGGRPGGYDDRVLRRAGRLADGYIPVTITPDEYRDVISRLDGYARDAGRAPSDITKALHTYYCLADTPSEAAETSSRTLSTRYGESSSVEADRTNLFGTASQCRDVLRAYIEVGVRHFVINPTCNHHDLERQLSVLAEEVTGGVD